MTPPPEQGDAEMRKLFEAWFVRTNGMIQAKYVPGHDYYLDDLTDDLYQSFKAGYQARDGKNEGGK